MDSTAVNEQDNVNLYSTRLLQIASYVAGPLGVSLVLFSNFIQIGQRKKAWITLLVGILITALVFYGIMILSEQIGKYTFGLVNNFTIGWIVYSVGFKIDKKIRKGIDQQLIIDRSPIGLILKLILLVVFQIVLVFIIAFAHLSSQGDKWAYNGGVQDYQLNWDKSDRYIDLFKDTNDLETIAFIQDSAIPLWQKNVVIANDLDHLNINNEEMKRQGINLKSLAELKIEYLKTLALALQNGFDQYDGKLDSLNVELDKVLDEL